MFVFSFSFPFFFHSSYFISLLLYCCAKSSITKVSPSPFHLFDLFLLSQSQFLAIVSFTSSIQRLTQFPAFLPILAPSLFAPFPLHSTPTSFFHTKSIFLSSLCLPFCLPFLLFYLMD